jgi:hypothetical protein
VNTVRYRDVLYAVLHLMGRNPDSGDFSPEEASMITSFVNIRLRIAWTWAWWPDLTRTEYMTYREVWSNLKTYAVGAEVWDPAGSKYYAALLENSNKVPSANSDDWEAITFLNKYIPYRHPNYEPIGHVHYISDTFPDHAGNGKHFHFTLTQRGVMVDKHAPDIVWVRYRVPVPNFSAEEVDAAKGYPAGYVVYGPDGHCYIATANIQPGEELWELDAYGNIQSGDGAPIQIWELDEGGNIQPTIIYQTFTDKWQRINFPQFLMPTIVRAAYSDYMRAKGQGDKAVVEDRNWMDELMHEADLLQQQQQNGYCIA